jgi:Uma2 family endonuclease
VIEVISGSTASYDRGPKFRAYERAGVREVWLIEPYGPAGTEFYQRQNEVLLPRMPNAGGVVQSTSLPGFKLNTAWLWPAQNFIPVRDAPAAM